MIQCNECSVYFDEHNLRWIVLWRGDPFRYYSSLDQAEAFVDGFTHGKTYCDYGASGEQGDKT